jgi:3'(2'), 5'-bisphosphate nucleotidase
MTELPSFITTLSALAQYACEAILTIYSQDFKAETKKDGWPVTEAGISSHDILITGLDKLLLGVPVLSEESQNIPYTDRLIDPLDGTKEFVRWLLTSSSAGDGHPNEH